MRRERIANPDPTLPSPPPFEEKAEAFRAQESLYGGTTPRLLVAGDSIARQWPERELQRLGVAPLARLAVSGDLTQHVLWRLQNTEVDLSGVEVALLVAGSNNLSAGNTADQIHAGLCSLVAAIKARAPSARVAVLQPPPRVARHDYAPETHAQLNRLIVERAAQGGYVAVVAPDLDPQDPSLYKDGLHLHRAGYKPLLRAVAQALGLTLVAAPEKPGRGPDPDLEA